MTSDHLNPEDVWPSLTQEDLERAGDPDREDSRWLADISPWRRDELRAACAEELQVLNREAKRRLDDGHPQYGEQYRVAEVLTQNGGFRHVVVSTESSE